MKGSGSTVNIKAIIFLWAVLFVVMILMLSCTDSGHRYTRRSHNAPALVKCVDGLPAPHAVS